jgi:hypothetical protein
MVLARWHVHTVTYHIKHLCLKHGSASIMAECLAAASDFQAMAPLQQHAAHNSKGGVASHWLNTQAKYSEPYDPNYPLKFQHSLIFNMIFYEYPGSLYIFAIVHPSCLFPAHHLQPLDLYLLLSRQLPLSQPLLGAFVRHWHITIPSAYRPSWEDQWLFICCLYVVMIG